jgi:hypothetical protein
VRSSCYGGSNGESCETTEATTTATTKAATTAAVVSSLTLKRAPIGWNKESYDVLEDGVRRQRSLGATDGLHKADDRRVCRRVQQGSISFRPPVRTSRLNAA